MPARENIVEALRKYDRLYKAARSFGVTTPTLKRWMQRYSISAEDIKAETIVVEQPKQLPWYKKLFGK